MAQKNYAIPECASVEIGIQTKSNRTKNKKIKVHNFYNLWNGYSSNNSYIQSLHTLRSTTSTNSLNLLKLYLRDLKITPITLFCNISSQVSLPESWAFYPKNYIIFVAGGLGWGYSCGPPPSPHSVRTLMHARSNPKLYKSVLCML